MRFERKRRKMPYVPTTSFGDIAFLLIIFFMVASVFMRESHIEVKEARSTDVERVEPMSVSVILDRQGQLWLQGERCPVDALESEVAALVQDRKDKIVTLKIDKDQVQKDFGDILLHLSGAGVDIVLLGEKEGRP